MAQWQDSFQAWGTAWAAVRGQDVEPDGGALALTGDDGQVEKLALWPGEEIESLAAGLTGADGGILWLATDQYDGAREFAGRHQLSAAEELVLLAAATNDLELAAELPEEAVVAAAPLERYDAVEIAVFDHPVASGRIRLDDELGVLGHIRGEAESVEGVAMLERAVIAALAEEAFLHGAEILYLVAEPEQAERFAAQGWEPLGRLLRLGTA